MAYTETTTTGWGERLGNSIKGIVTGLVLIVVGTVLLWWNEGRTFKTAGAIGEAQMLAEDVADISKADPALSGKVIHATGHADTKDVLRDPIFGIETTAIRLEREVEYYQWEEESQSETRKKLGGGEETVTTYTYKQDWNSSPIDSGSFHDPRYRGVNTVLANIEDESQWAPHVTFGAYTLPDSLKHSISGAMPMTLTSVDAVAVTGTFNITPDNDSWRLYYGNVSADKLIHVSGSTVYLGREPGSPKVGDVRITFKQVPPADVSIIARVIRDTFEPYIATNGYTFIRLDMGTVSKEQMFADAKSGNNFMAWVLRLIGLLVVAAGIGAVLSPLSVLADVIPLLGDIVGAGVSLVAFLLGLAWSCIVIAVAWVRFRPIVAGCLLAAAAVLIGFLFLKGRRKTAQ
ncbi:MAG: TMEM43 family protein [Fretibacterium sp.]|nr:TMEM43 family protein [Fretibacterium sp.]